MTVKRGYETWEKVAAVLGGGNDERELRQWESIRWACSRVGESVRLSGTGAIGRVTTASKSLLHSAERHPLSTPQLV